MNKVTKYSLGLAVLMASGSAQALTCNGKEITIFGTPGNDVIQGTMARDVIHGLGGHDKIIGGLGNDVICGGSGNDFIIAGPGADYASGQFGKDRIYGSFGNDRIYGGPGDDVLKGGRHHDRIYGGGSGILGDEMSGELGSDVMYAGDACCTQMAGPDYKYVGFRFVLLDGPKDFRPGDIDWCHRGTSPYWDEFGGSAACYTQFGERPQHPVFPNIRFPGPGTIEPNTSTTPDTDRPVADVPVVEAPEVIEVVEPIVELPVEDGVVEITNIVE